DGFRYDRHRRTAWNDAEQIVPAAAHSAAMPFDQLAQRYAHRLFDIAGRVHVAGKAVDLGARVARPADTGKPSRAAPQARRYHCDGLDIVDRGRAAIQADLRREWGLQAMLALAACEARQQAGLFTANMRTGSAVL